ncbi:hypothetical protein [Nocardia sp. SYP-A9097]|uniref:hypothetical protein n=1 Tax=Nocardia sp. SYP-A9097 TaxID=2663237 RepID=UPI001E303F7C|nr:hypothetical protein [Nocardia sp. SYP-A9097]
MSRVAHLRALIEHPGTGADERAAAQRMLDRIMSKPDVRAAGDERSYGPRYTRVGKHADLESIAELIRDDIAFVRVVFADAPQTSELRVADAIRDAPAEITYSVVGLPQENSIEITIEGVPAEWGGAEGVSPQLRQLADELVDLLNSYNHEGAAIGRRFFARVRTPHETLVW